MKRYVRIWILAMLLWCGGCASGTKDVTVEEREMAFSFNLSRSAGTSKPVFLFWYTEELPNIGTGPGYVQPYHVSEPENDIDSYKEVKFNTGKTYPADLRRVSAVGYYPSDLIVEKVSGVKNYGKLSVPPDSLGKMDVMVSAPIRGSMLNTFTSPMKFEHVQSMLEFTAIRSSKMVKFVQYAKVTVPAGSLMDGVHWSANDNAYLPVSESSSTRTVTLSTDELLDALSDDPSYTPVYRDLGYVYIHPHFSEITVEVTAQVFPREVTDPEEIQSAAYTRTYSGVKIAFTDSGENSIALVGGDKYAIELVFDDETVEIVARKCDWEDGGTVVVPVATE